MYFLLSQPYQWILESYDADYIDSKLQYTLQLQEMPLKQSSTTHEVQINKGLLTFNLLPLSKAWNCWL